jgi:CDP-diglyceride synthetase
MFKSILIRSLSGLVFMGLVVGALLWHPYSYILLLLFITTVMCWEYFRMSIGKAYGFAQVCTFLAGWMLLGLCYGLAQGRLLPQCGLVLLLPLVAIRISLIYHKKEDDYIRASRLFEPLLYIFLPLALTCFLVFQPDGFYGLRLLSLFIILWSSDVGAYVFGIAFGQRAGSHKLFPRLSPKKSWEGFFGGWLCALIAGFLLSYWNALPYSLVHCLIMATLLHVFGVWGDLIESQIKRQAGIKDSGHIMPGHGGLLDRFDSALIAFPVVIAYIIIAI